MNDRYALDQIQFPDTPFPLDPSLTLLARRGSEAHGTYVAPEDETGIDDRDLMGVCIPPELWSLGIRRWEGADAIKGPWDVVLYDLRKFVRLLCQQNPNVLAVLWVEPEDILKADAVGWGLVEHRDLFRTRTRAYESFVGYAKGQLSKMTVGAFAGFMGAKRKRLVERFGYDCKNAAHLVRLLHMGVEYLQTGHLNVRRTWDRDMILEIKKGGWKIEAVKAYADDYFAKMNRALEESTLPDEIDTAAVEELLIGWMRMRL